jgi:large subunit ribosomal protein L5
MQVPKLEKIVLSRGVGAAVSDKKLIDYAVDELTKITGQKAVSTISKKDVASFKLRKGMPIGAKVTLRGERMYEFLDRLLLLLYHVYVILTVSKLLVLTEEVTITLVF